MSISNPTHNLPNVKFGSRDVYILIGTLPFITFLDKNTNAKVEMFLEDYKELLEFEEWVDSISFNYGGYFIFKNIHFEFEPNYAYSIGVIKERIETAKIEYMKLLAV